MKIGNFIISLRMPKKFDKYIHIALIALLLFGTIMIASISSASVDGTKALLFDIVKQVVFVVVAYIAMVFFANNFTMIRMKKWYVIIAVLLVMAMISTLFFRAQYGSRAWIRLGPFTLQPSEFVKVFMIALLGLFAEMARTAKGSILKIAGLPLFLYILFSVIIMFQKDLGCVIILFLLMVILLFLVKDERFKNLKKVALVALVGLGLFFGYCFTDEGLAIVEKIPFVNHVAPRFKNCKDPFENPSATGFQAINGLYGITRGGLKGVGFGESIQKYGYLTQSDNDYIFSIVVEETGITGFFLIFICYAVIIVRSFKYAFKTKSPGYQLILIGNAMYIFLHFVLNVGGTSGLIPLTGVPLLLISSGGSSMWATMIAMGISQSIIGRIERQGAGTSKTVKKRVSVAKP